MDDLELHPWTKIAPTLGVIFISPALLTVGATIGTILPMEMAVAVSIIASLIFSCIIYLHGGVGSREHMPFLKIMEASLGIKGSRFFASPLITITQIGWFSILITLGGEALSNLIPLSNIFSITLFGVLVASVTYFGFTHLSKFTKVTALVTGTFVLWALYSILINNSIPPETPTGDFIYALALAVGGAISISTVSPDFVKGARSIRDLKITSFLVILPVVVFSLISGSLIGHYSLIPNPVQALTVIGLPVVANFLLLLGSAAAASSLYPPSIALSKLTGVDRKKATAFAAFAGLVIANIGILEQLRSFLQLIGILLPPLIGINIAEYYVLSKRLVPKQGLYLRGLVSWMVGAFFGALFPVGIVPLNSLLVSFMIYLTLHFNS
ncbi:MAG: cytosine permease [Candidatus Methanomethyliaceae archaeon]|nr:cytosine permease [Candidatus Methanomethyliaceae archaeon]